MKPVALDEQYVLNHCAKYVARRGGDTRHDFGQYIEDPASARVCEAWRFPVVDSYSDGVDPVESYALNRVTFVYAAALDASGSSEMPGNVAVIGTFANLYEPLALARVRFQGEDTAYFALTVAVPKGEVHTYKFVIDGRPALDPINPQRKVLDNGRVWSRFFTHLCTVPLVLERWEAAILERFTSHVLPFRTPDGERFVDLYYNGLDRQTRDTQYARAYRLDQHVGVVNYIDKLLAREEAHHLIDYRICLREIDRLLRARNPYVDPADMPRDFYVELYEQMHEGAVPGWSYDRYGNPHYFLELLRRHTLTGAFSHPKYGGNSAATGWAYLEDRFRDARGGTLFDWRRAIERPLGESVEYAG